MNPELKSFFDEERKRIFEPTPFFAQRVMARLRHQARESGFWEVVPAATRPVFAVALMLLFAVLAIQILVPVEPSRGPIEAYVSSDLTPSETLMFIGVELPTNAAQVEELILEPGR